MSVPLEVEATWPRRAPLPFLLLLSVLLNIFLFVRSERRGAKLDACEQRTDALAHANEQQRFALDRALKDVEKMLGSARQLEQLGCGRLLVPAVPYPSRWSPESPTYRDPHGWYRKALDAGRSPLLAGRK